MVLPLPVLNAVPCKLASGLGQALGTLYLVRLATWRRRLGALRPQGSNPNPHWLNPTYAPRQHSQPRPIQSS